MIAPPNRVNTLAALMLFLLPVFLPSATQAAPQAKCLLLTHYMPWFAAKPFSPQWGWHWTMNHFDPQRRVNGQPEVASHYSPLIGPYDSDDPDVLRCQVLLMKLAGIDGVIVDWYGNDDYMDFGVNNRNTERLLPIVQAAGLRFAICYEDQTVPKEISGGIFPDTDAVAHGQRLMQWMQTNFFSSPAYLKLDNRPVLLSFGEPFYQDFQWSQVFSVLPQKPLYFTESSRQEPTASVGGFDWPLPQGGTQDAFQQQDLFYQRFQSSPLFIAAAFPRFDDIYSQAGVGKSWGHIEDQQGQTYIDTLSKALQSHAPIVQIVTWNDWGEGTQIEPSVEYGYRDPAPAPPVSGAGVRSGGGGPDAAGRVVPALQEVRGQLGRPCTAGRVFPAGCHGTHRPRPSAAGKVPIEMRLRWPFLYASAIRCEAPPRHGRGAFRGRPGRLAYFYSSRHDAYQHPTIHPDAAGKRETPVPNSGGAGWSQTESTLLLRFKENLSMNGKDGDTPSLNIGKAISRARLVHGKGTGALRRAVQEYVSSHPLVAEYATADSEEGGAEQPSSRCG